MSLELLAKLHTDGWAGRVDQDCVVIEETPRRYRIRVLGRKAIRLAGRARVLGIGRTALVPKYAITIIGPLKLGDR